MPVSRTAKRRRRALALAGAAAVCLALGDEAAALPIGFGVNQGDLDYDESRSDHFIVYHDARVPTEGQLTVNALEAARPHLERWFRQHRERPLPVIMSAVTENASFADFITDALELQTMGQTTKDLAWHEYTHSTMYRAFDSFLGPAYSIINLPWMPAWFLEGLAEAMSVSVGSDVTAGIERYQALAGDWPSYDRLHSLYSKANFFERGYSTSGAITSWLLRKGDANKLPSLLDDFYRYTLPWWYPVSVFRLPMDRALTNYVALDGPELYELYKKEATKFWQSAPAAPFLMAESAERLDIGSLYGLTSDGKTLWHAERIGYDVWEVALKVDDKTGWVTGSKKSHKFPDGSTAANNFHNGDWQVDVRHESEHKNEKTTIALTPPGKGKGKGKGKPAGRTLTRTGYVFGLWEMPDRFVWLEQQQAQTRLCSWRKAGGDAGCPQTDVVPKKLRSLGYRPRRPGDPMAQEVWLVESEERLTGTSYAVRILDAKANALGPPLVSSQARPEAVAFAGADAWILLAERNQRTLRRYGPKGECLGMLRFKDHVLGVQGLADGSLVLDVYAGDHIYLRRLKKTEQHETACVPEDAHTSPIQWALVHGGAPDLKAAMAGSSLWQAAPVPPTVAEAEAFAKRPPADEDVVAGTHTQTEPKPAKWRGHPLFVFPWIGADDALGPQVGIVSVPLTDQMQTETVRATLLYGVYSRFPYSEVTLTSTRFRPTLNLALYREQTYNGVATVPLSDGTFERRLSYYEEKGVRLESLTDFRALGGAGSFGLAVKDANLKPYIGPNLRAQGNLIEPGASLSLTHGAGRLTTTNGVAGRLAPAALNQHFDYNQVGASTLETVALPLDSKATVGLEMSRTRGPKERVLKEYYTPLKTFIPGSGGGYNKNSFPFPLVHQNSTALFDPYYGDTQGRALADWTVPVIPDVDKELWIVYLERLDFTAFYNYGGAWNGPRPYYGWSRLVRADGFNLDLQLENKGVRFNLGVGVGQVIGAPWQSYVNFGFDALF